MKKIIILFLASILLTSCISFNNETPTETPTDAEPTTPVENETTTVPDDMDTTVTDDTDTTVPDDTDTTISDDTDTTETDEINTSVNIELDILPIQAYVSLKDFYTLLTERSSNPEDYETFNRRYSQILRVLPDGNVLIPLEDFNLVNIDNFEEGKNFRAWTIVSEPTGTFHYGYSFVKARIQVYYNPEYSPSDIYTINIGGNKSYIEGGLSAFSNNPSINQVYTEYIDDSPIYYTIYQMNLSSDKTLSEYEFYVVTENFCVLISLREEAFDDPEFASLLNFFKEDTYQDAVRDLVEVIESVENQEALE